MFDCGSSRVRGASAVKAHSFLQDVDWTDLQSEDPLLVLQLVSKSNYQQRHMTNQSHI